MWTSAIFCSKTIEFFEIYGVPERTKGGLCQCGYFADKGGGDYFFAILCGRPIWTAPNNK